MAGTETPATEAARAAGVVFTLHEYDHDPGAASYGVEAVAALGVLAERVLKTLVVARDRHLVVCIVPVAAKLRLKAVGKHAELADPVRAQRTTGYVVGGISPLGQRKRLPTLLDTSAIAFSTVFVSAGRRGLEIELAPADLVALTDADIRTLT